MNIYKWDEVPINKAIISLKYFLFVQKSQSMKILC